MNEIKTETGNKINAILNEINQYKNIIEQQKLNINDLKNKLNNVIEINKNNSKSIELFKNTIKNKEEELNSLNIKLQDINNKIISQNKNLLNKYNNMSVRIVSTDQKIDYLIQCNADDIFYTLVEKLYLEYPDYRSTENVFMSEGRKINENKTIAQNNIKNGDTIIFFNLND